MNIDKLREALLFQLKEAAYNRFMTATINEKKTTREALNEVVEQIVKVTWEPLIRPPVV